MSDEGVLRSLRDDPNSFEFFQAVRLLQLAMPDRAPVGGFADPGAEVVRFSAHPSIAFPASEIQTLDDEAGGAAPAEMTVNFMGLIGPQGVLPLQYTLLAAERARERDTALRDFFDIFNHRIISLFYRAWEKNRFIVARERGGEDRLARHVRDLIGMGGDSLENRLPVADDALVFYAGLLGMRSRSAAALESLLGDYFAVPVRVEQFVGAWYRIDRATQCEVGDESSPSSALGLGAVAGDEVWNQESRIRVRLGPLARDRYDEFLPGGSAYATLHALTRFFTGGDMDVEIQLVLARAEVPACVLGAAAEEAAPLGWCSWLRTRPFDSDADDTVLTLQH